MNLVWIFVGGGLGSVVRYLVQMAVCRSLPLGFPVGTFVVNIVGCLLIGLLYGASARWDVPENVRLMLTVGLCGGFTTFSTFSAESLALIRDGFYWMSLLYIAGSVVLGIAAVFLGIRIMECSHL